MRSYFIKCHNSGNSWVTSFNGSHVDAIDYFLGHTFTRECQVTGRETHDKVSAVFSMDAPYEYMRTSVYKVQCFTFKLLCARLGHSGESVCTTGNSPLSRLRILPKYRTAQDIALRDSLARKIKSLRRGAK